MIPDWVTSTTLIALCGITWTELRSLRLTLTEVRDALLAAGIIKPK